MRCEQMPKGLDLMVFDFGFTAGPGTSVRQLQTVLHRGNVKIAIDGMIGPLTINETLHIADPAFPGQLGTLITQVAQQQLRYYQGLTKWSLYGRGWARRNTACLDAALRMAGLKG
jgi:lysozyme family protein